MSLSSISQHAVFVINLDRSPERLEHMRQLFAQQNIDFTRIAGVDGQTLSKDELEKVYDPEHCKKLIGRELRLGEVGCTLSHIRAWKKIIHEQLDGAFIFEDDIVLTEDAHVKEALSVGKLFQDQPAVFLLSPHSEILSKPLNLLASQSFRLFRSKKSALACGYYVNRKAAQNLVNYFDKVHHVNDWWATMRRRQVITSYLVQTLDGRPFVTPLPQEALPSTITHEQQRGTPKASWFAKLMRKYYAHTYFRQQPR